MEPSVFEPCLNFLLSDKFFKKDKFISIMTKDKTRYIGEDICFQKEKKFAFIKKV